MPVKCDSGCYPICDFCKFFDDDAPKECKYSDDMGFCLYHNSLVSICDDCEFFECFNTVRLDGEVVKWGKKLPKEPGWYWWRPDVEAEDEKYVDTSDLYRPSVVEVADFLDELFAFFSDGMVKIEDSTINGKWWPIPINEPPAMNSKDPN